MGYEGHERKIACAMRGGGMCWALRAVMRLGFACCNKNAGFCLGKNNRKSDPVH